MADTTSTQPEAGTLRRLISSCTGITERDRRNSRRANLWLFVWMLSFVQAVLAIKNQWISPGFVTWLAIAGSTAFGLIAVRKYMNFLREADELLRKIHLEALALGFGAGFLATFTMSLIERVRDQPFDLGDVFLVMVIFYVIGVIVGTRRYA